MVHLEARASSDAITEMADWAEARAVGHGLEAEAVFMARLCVEEAVTNVLRYAYDDEPSRHVITLEVGVGEGSAQFIITDDGRPFDPVAMADPGREGHILDASVGGRGIRLMRKFAKAMSYERRDGLNRLTLSF